MKQTSEPEQFSCSETNFPQDCSNEPIEIICGVIPMKCARGTTCSPYRRDYTTACQACNDGNHFYYKVSCADVIAFYEPTTTPVIKSELVDDAIEVNPIYKTDIIKSTRILRESNTKEEKVPDVTPKITPIIKDDVLIEKKPTPLIKTPIKIKPLPPIENKNKETECYGLKFNENCENEPQKKICGVNHMICINPPCSTIYREYNSACEACEAKSDSYIEGKCPGPVSPPINDKIYCAATSFLPNCEREYVKTVCGTTEIQCITTPCNPIVKEYPSACQACAEGVTYYSERRCPKKLDNTPKENNENNNNDSDFEYAIIYPDGTTFSSVDNNSVKEDNGFDFEYDIVYSEEVSELSIRPPEDPIIAIDPIPPYIEYPYDPTEYYCNYDERFKKCNCNNSSQFVCAQLINKKNQDEFSDLEYYRCKCEACSDRHVSKIYIGLCPKHRPLSKNETLKPYVCNAADRRKVCKFSSNDDLCAVTNNGIEFVSDQCSACNRSDVIAVYKNSCPLIEVSLPRPPILHHDPPAPIIIEPITAYPQPIPIPDPKPGILEPIHPLPIKDVVKPVPQKEIKNDIIKATPIKLVNPPKIELPVEKPVPLEKPITTASPQSIKTIKPIPLKPNILPNQKVIAQ